jgi:hypothetical protein
MGNNGIIIRILSVIEKREREHSLNNQKSDNINPLQISGKLNPSHDQNSVVFG